MIRISIIITILQNTILTFCSASDSLGKYSGSISLSVYAIVAIEEHNKCLRQFYGGDALRVCACMRAYRKLI